MNLGLQYRLGAVGGAVVHYDDFLFGNGRGDDGGNNGADRFPFIVARYDNRELHEEVGGRIIG